MIYLFNMKLKDKVTSGVSEKQYVKVDLTGLDVSDEPNSFAIVNVKMNNLKIKLYINGRKRKIHITKEEFEVIKKLVKILLK